jgi:hypothetical protein
MEKRVKLFITFALLIILVAMLYIFTDWFSRVTGYFTGEDEISKLSQCLKKENSQLYISLNCAACEKQKNLFNKAINSLTIVDCSSDGENCPNIRELPAWYIKGSIYYGYKNISELKDLSGCIMQK